MPRIFDDEQRQMADLRSQNRPQSRRNCPRWQTPSWASLLMANDFVTKAAPCADIRQTLSCVATSPARRVHSERPQAYRRPSQLGNRSNLTATLSPSLSVE
jgi:hypothetical protein